MIKLIMVDGIKTIGKEMSKQKMQVTINTTDRHKTIGIFDGTGQITIPYEPFAKYLR